jgi:hypothetical protein
MWVTDIPLRLDVRQLTATAGEGARVYGSLLGRVWPMWSGLLVLLVLRLKEGRLPRLDPATRSLLAWSASVSVLIGLVHVEERYVAGFVIVSAMSLYSAMVRGEAWRDRAVCGAVALWLGLQAAIGIGSAALGSARDHLYQRIPDEFRVARTIADLGIAPGGSLAVVGDAYGLSYAARLAGVSIKAQVLEPEIFWNLNAAERLRFLDRLRAAGIDAIAATGGPTGQHPPAWLEVPRTRFQRYSLHKLGT